MRLGARRWLQAGRLGRRCGVRSTPDMCLVDTIDPCDEKPT